MTSHSLVTVTVVKFCSTDSRHFNSLWQVSNNGLLSSFQPSSHSAVWEGINHPSSSLSSAGKKNAKPTCSSTLFASKSRVRDETKTPRQIQSLSLSLSLYSTGSKSWSTPTAAGLQATSSLTTMFCMKSKFDILRSTFLLRFYKHWWSRWILQPWVVNQSMNPVFYQIRITSNNRYWYMI